MSGPAPVVLASSLVNLLGQPRGAQVSFPVAIWNTEPIGVLIDRIHFYAQNGSYSDLLGTNVDAPGTVALQRFSLRFHNEPITNGFVRLAAMAEREELGGEVITGKVTMKLSKPLWLGPKERIEGAVEMRTPTALLGPYNVQIVAVGVQSPMRPAERWLPYFAAVEGGEITRGGTAPSVISTPQDLGNPFKTPIFVERLIVEAVQERRANGDGYPASLGATSVLHHLTLKLADDRDDLWIPTAIPFAVAANPLDRSWIVNTGLRAGAYLRAEIGGDAAWGTYGNADLGSTAIPLVGLKGYRRIS